MHLINIFPLGNICMEYTQDMHMFLTHMVEKYPTYAKVAQDAPGYKILDNSLIELGGAVSVERVIGAATYIGADEIILPDVFQNGPETIKAVQDALNTLHKMFPKGDWPFKLMAVAQGADEEEWLDCYEYLLDMREVDVIGIPKVLAKMHPQGRPYFVNELCELHKKPHHLLGLWYSIAELFEYRNLEQIRSCDTVLLGFMAKHSMSSIGTRPDGFTVDLEKDVIDYTQLKSDLNLNGVFSGKKYACGGIVCRK